jgi:hypothetical protein
MKEKIVIISLLIFIYSCNKKKTATPIVTASSVATTYQTGLIELVKSQYFDGTSMVTVGENVTISFINYDTNSSIEVPAGNVNFNGTNLSFDGINYEDTNFTVNYVPTTYSVSASGSGQIDAFSATFPQSYPSFTGDGLLPITVSKSNGFTINLGNSIVNITDTSTIQLFNSAVKKIVPGQTTVSFTPADLSSVMIASGYYFEINLYNTQALIINGSNYYVRNSLLFTKYNIDVTP